MSASWFRPSCFGLLVLLVALPGAWTSSPDFSGRWSLLPDRSTAVDPWRSLVIEMQVDGPQVTVKRIWSGNREAGSYVDSMTVPTNGEPHEVYMQQWPDNRHLGAYISGNHMKQVTAAWLDDDRTLRVESRLPVSTSQGERQIRIYTEYRLTPDGEHLEVLELRSTRPRPIHYIFRRADA